MMCLIVSLVLATAVVSSATVIKSPQTGAISPNFELLILHNNDMHARFEETSQLSGACTAKDKAEGKCYGGFARVAHVVKEARSKAATGEGPPVLYLNAGDTYTGTAWFTIYKWKIAAEFINALKPDAVSLGNHEFDETVEGLIPFINNISAPVVAANLILEEVPQLQELKNLQNSIILGKNGVKIGIIGYLTPDTRFLAPKNNVEYEDEVIAIKREVKILKKHKVNILIALGHSGYIKDVEIAQKIEDLDLVIGGHSNTFLWNGHSEEKPEIQQGPYPVVINHPSGRKVLVVQAYAYTKYLGSLHLIFDAKGDVTAYDGSPILLDNSVPEDPELLEIVETYRNEINRISNEIVGSSNVFLDGDCRLRECNMGNVITDSLLNYIKQHYYEYPNVTIAICQSGRIRASIDRAQKPFNLTRGDWMTALPFTDTLTIVKMNGSILRQALEHSVALWRPIDSVGQFLQFSGIRVTYDLLKPPGSRIVEAFAVCSGCDELSHVADHLDYRVMMPAFLAEGGDGYSIFINLPQDPLPYNELTCIYDYLKEHRVKRSELSGRIVLMNEDKAISMFQNAQFKENKQMPSSGITIQSNHVINIVILLLYTLR